MIGLTHAVVHPGFWSDQNVDDLGGLSKGVVVRFCGGMFLQAVMAPT